MSPLRVGAQPVRSPPASGRGDVVTAEDGAAWLAFLRSLVARGLAGVKLVSSDAHPGSWQRCS